MQSTKQIFDNFVGIWSIKRILGNYGTAEGTAKFTLENKSETTTSATASDENTLVINYREDLQVKYNSNFALQQLGATVENTAYKEYVYLYNRSTDKIIKKFSNGNLFYELSIDFEKQVADGDHLCEKDFYKASYDFIDAQNFVLTYFVNGPKKDYEITTEFTKQVTDSKS